MKNKIFLHAALSFMLLSAISFTACADTDSVKIISLTPGNDKPLYVGSTVTITAEVEYNLQSANTASITLVIQQAETGHRPLANEIDVALKGTGKIKLSKGIVVPETRALTIFMPLTPEGNQSTTTVDSRMYKVITNNIAVP